MSELDQEVRMRFNVLDQALRDFIGAVNERDKKQKKQIMELQNKVKRITKLPEEGGEEDE